MSALRQLASQADESLRPYAVPNPGDGDTQTGVSVPVRAFVLEAIREGYLMHYDQPRAFAGMDEDLRLLAGDSLYALGLARLAEVGDLAAVAELAELIARCAEAEADARRERVGELWRGSAERLARGLPDTPTR